MGLDLHALADAANDLHRIADALEKIADTWVEAVAKVNDERKGERDARSDS